VHYIFTVLNRKSNQGFWKIWKAKFPNASADISQVDGIAECDINHIVQIAMRLLKPNTKRIEQSISAQKVLFVSWLINFSITIKRAIVRVLLQLRTFVQLLRQCVNVSTCLANRGDGSAYPVSCVYVCVWCWCIVAKCLKYGAREGTCRIFFTRVADMPSRRRLRSSGSDRLHLPIIRRSTVGSRTFTELFRRRGMERPAGSRHSCAVTRGLQTAP